MTSKRVNDAVDGIIARGNVTRGDLEDLSAAVGRNVDAGERSALDRLGTKIARNEIVAAEPVDLRFASQTRWRTFKEGLTPSAMLLGMGPGVALGMGNGSATPVSVALGVLVGVVTAPLAVVYAPIGAILGAVNALRD